METPQNRLVVVTGAAGFIGSALVGRLNSEGYHNIIAVDDFSRKDKVNNLEGKTLVSKVGRKDFIAWLNDFGKEVDFVFHIGARTDTTEFDKSILDAMNLNFSKDVWKACVQAQIPLVYASSAATYGLGEFGYVDDHALIPNLKPLNPYGESKNDFDKWVLQQDTTPPFWYGLKFFNVYGPNEYHKGRMASVILHAFKQIEEHGAMKLFRSHNPNYTDGGQLRDFIYVKDVLEVALFLMENKPNSAIYNLGTGKARTFLDLANATFKSVGKEPNIQFVDTPEDIRDKYQYFTEADMSKLISQGYTKPFHTLEEGIEDYVSNFLLSNKYY